MGNVQSYDREGNPVTSLSELCRKTAKYAGIPNEVAVYVVTSFVEVLANEIVTEGGASIPGVITFSTVDVKEKDNLASRYGAMKRYDQDLKVNVNDILKTLHRLHSTFCTGDEQVITPSTWQAFMKKYGKVLRKNDYGSGVVSLTKVRKSSAPANSRRKEDFVDVDQPLKNDYFKRLIEQMNKLDFFDVSAHIEDGELLWESDERLLRATDLTEETAPYVTANNLEKVSLLLKLAEEGKINGEFLQNLTKKDVLKQPEQ